MRKITLIGFALLFSLNAISQDSKIDKIESLIDLLNTEQRMSSMIDNLINESLKTADSYDSLFWKEYKVKSTNIVNDTLKPQIVAIYDKYFTDLEIDYMHDFYSSDIGKQTLYKYDQMLQEIMLLGLNVGEKISEQIVQEIEEKEDREIGFKMNNVFEGCSRFQVGKFEQVVNENVTFYYERDENRQIETFGEGRAVYDIKWLNDCRYTLTLVETNNPYSQEFIGSTTVVNIYESDDKTYKFYYKLQDSDDIYEGEMKMIN